MPSLPPLDHIGYVVPDVAEAVTELQSLHGLRDSRGTFDARWEDALLRQDRVCFGARYHFLTLGTTDLEVIAPIGDDPSPYREFLGAGGLGMHHLAFVVPSIDEHLAARSGLNVVLDARLQPDGRFVYVEGVLAGVLVELIQMPSLSPAP